eukprot:3290774-Rhodomonas_salina.1
MSSGAEHGGPPLQPVPHPPTPLQPFKPNRTSSSKRRSEGLPSSPQHPPSALADQRCDCTWPGFASRRVLMCADGVTCFARLGHGELCVAGCGDECVPWCCMCVWRGAICVCVTRGRGSRQIDNEKLRSVLRGSSPPPPPSPSPDLALTGTLSSPPPPSLSPHPLSPS